MTTSSKAATAIHFFAVADDSNWSLSPCLFSFKDMASLYLDIPLSTLRERQFGKQRRGQTNLRQALGLQR